MLWTRCHLLRRSQRLSEAEVHIPVRKHRGEIVLVTCSHHRVVQIMVAIPILCRDGVNIGSSNSTTDQSLPCIAPAPGCSLSSCAHKSTMSKLLPNGVLPMGKLPPAAFFPSDGGHA